MICGAGSLACKPAFQPAFLMIADKPAGRPARSQDWLPHPPRTKMIHSLIQYALLVFGLMGSLALFLSMKREIRIHAYKTAIRMAEIAAQQPVFVAALPRSGMNASKRVQAMRMLRRNEDISHISAALGVPRKEVELLIRVQQVVAATALKVTAAAD